MMQPARQRTKEAQLLVIRHRDHFDPAGFSQWVDLGFDVVVEIVPFLEAVQDLLEDLVGDVEPSKEFLQ